MTCFIDENAVSFAQAEKLYYETSLINVSNDIQQEQGEAGECTFPNRIENNKGRAGRGRGSELNASHILIHCTSCFCFLLPYIVVPWVFSIAKYCCETVSYFSHFLPFLLLSPVDLPPPLFPGSHPLSPHHIIMYTYCPIPCACTYMRTYATHQHSSPSSI